MNQVDRDMDGTIDPIEMMELFTTHPDMLKRIKHLSTLSAGAEYP